jgi:subtilase family serine protease
MSAASAVVAAAIACALPGAAQARAVRVGRPPVLPPGAQRQDGVRADLPLRLQVVLSPRDPEALANFVAAVSDPASPLYRQFLARGEFAERFGASPASVDAVREALRAQGLEPGRLAADGLTLPVAITAARAEQALGVSLASYRLRGGRTVFANTSAPQLPGGVAARVRAIAGLDDLAQRRPRLRRTPAATAPASGAACPAATGAASANGAFTPAGLAAAYAIDGLRTGSALGAGVTVAIYELERNRTADIAAYQACFGTSATVTYTSVDGGATGGAAGKGEAALDIETVIGLAPRAALRVYRGPNAGDGPLDTYRRIVTDDTAQVITTSWGLCERDMTPAESAAENTIFEQAAAQGQTVVAASGDDGSEDCGDPGDTSLAVDDPAGQPFVTGVGGTTLHTSPSRSETVWNNAAGAGGGGRSATWTSLPSYQAGVLPAGGRGVPDVSADADPGTGYVVYHAGAWTAFGGTSAASPLWGALVAIAESSNLGSCAPGAPLGFLNPALYGIGTGGAAGASFHDVVAGDNDLAGDHPGSFNATAGYDLASGLGTPLAYSSSSAGLVPALCGATGAPAITTLSAASGPPAGGTSVTISGFGLSAGTPAVHFGPADATSVQAVSDNAITAVTPAGTGTVPVTVTAGGGTSRALSYTYSAGAAPANPAVTTNPQPPTATTPASPSPVTPVAPPRTVAPATRKLLLKVSGALHYKLTGKVKASAVSIARDAKGRLRGVHARVTLPGADGGHALVVIDAVRRSHGWTGKVTVSDPRAKLKRRFRLAGTPRVGQSGAVSGSARLALGHRAARLAFTLARPSR